MTEIKPVAWTSKKGLRHLATMGFLSVGKHEDRERKIPLYGPEAADEITRLRQLLSEAETREAEARAKALEEAALWHDAKVQEYTDQIAVNDAYLARGGRLSHESRANEYCDDMRSCHRRSAEHLRSMSGRAALERSDG